MPSAIAVFPTPGSPIRQGLFFLLRTRVRRHIRTSSSRPYTSSSSPFIANSVKSDPQSASVGVALAEPDIPVTSSAPSESFTSRTSVRQNSVEEKLSASMPSIRRMTARAPLANPSSSIVAAAFTLPSSSVSYSNRASRTCSELIVGESISSAIREAAVRTRLSPCVNGNSTSLALLLRLNIRPMPPAPPLLSSLSLSSLNISETVRLTFRRVIPYFFRVVRAFSGRSTIPRNMISVPTLDCPREADSFCAETRAPMHSSDIRSNSMDRDVTLRFPCFWVVLRLEATAASMRLEGTGATKAPPNFVAEARLDRATSDVLGLVVENAAATAMGLFLVEVPHVTVALGATSAVSRSADRAKAYRPRGIVDSE
mmetsp:Transcript_11935/g.25840  ORF Transcript_11935/g.25840 Transcript_11935/m.25840 type:complete len:370 (+) Transcript_11935:2270-3379(+)